LEGLPPFGATAFLSYKIGCMVRRAQMLEHNIVGIDQDMVSAKYLKSKLRIVVDQVLVHAFYEPPPESVDINGKVGLLGNGEKSLAILVYDASQQVIAPGHPGLGPLEHNTFPYPTVRNQAEDFIEPFIAAIPANGNAPHGLVLKIVDEALQAVFMAPDHIRIHFDHNVPLASGEQMVDLGADGGSRFKGMNLNGLGIHNGQGSGHTQRLQVGRLDAEKDFHGNGSLANAAFYRAGQVILFPIRRYNNGDHLKIKIDI